MKGYQSTNVLLLILVIYFTVQTLLTIANTITVNICLTKAGSRYNWNLTKNRTANNVLYSGEGRILTAESSRVIKAW